MAQKFPDTLVSLIAHLKKLPGVGARTAERFAFEFITWNQPTLSSFAATIQELKEKVVPCIECGCLTDQNSCRFCASRHTDSLCIIASPRDAYALEETHSYHGLYHVIEHLLSPLDGRHTSGLNLEKLEARIAKHNIQEIIIALDSTLEGDATALYLKQALTRGGLSISRLAFGIPIGTSLEHIDGGTLTRALVGRQIV